MADPNREPQGRHREVVVAYAWASPTVSISGEAQLERIRRHCFEQKWRVARELVARRRPELGELARLVLETGAQHVVLAREVAQDLQCHVSGLWAELHGRFDRRDVTVVAV
jgi:hypothetical protein